MIEVLILFAILGAVICFWVAMITGIVSTGRYPPPVWNEIGRSKGGTIAGIIITGGVGGIYYWLVIHRELIAAAEDLKRRPVARPPKVVRRTGQPRGPKAPAWYGDPTGRHEARWWDGGHFTSRVRDGDAEAGDSLADDWFVEAPEQTGE